MKMVGGTAAPLLGPRCFLQLRQQFVTVDGLVDDVVATYHNGFNKAIHNYSQILQLFADTKAQVGGLGTRGMLRLCCVMVPRFIVEMTCSSMSVLKCSSVCRWRR